MASSENGPFGDIYSANQTDEQRQMLSAITLFPWLEAGVRPLVPAEVAGALKIAANAGEMYLPEETDDDDR